MLKGVKKPVIIAHSGCMNKPEGTLEFMSAGYKAGAQGFEIDLNITLDSVGVLSHDDKIPDDDGRIMDLGQIIYSEAQKRKKTLITFEKAIEKAKEYSSLMNVDIKNINAVPIALKIIKKMNFIDNVYFTGIGLEDAELLREEFPELRVAVNLKMKYGISNSNAALQESAQNATLLCKQIGAYGINVEWSLCGREWIEYAHSLGLITSCWTVDNVKDMQEVIDWGTDLITTNNPDQLALLLKEGAWKQNT